MATRGSPVRWRWVSLLIGIVILGIAISRVGQAAVVGGICAIASLVSFLNYAIDKAAAKSGRRRISEDTLHLFDLIGGWPGGLLAQALFRHKVKKGSFQALFWALVVLNLLVIAGVGWVI